MMLGVGGRRRCPPGTFLTTAEQLTREQQLEVAVIARRHRRAGASAWSGRSRSRIVVTDPLLDAPAPVQQFVAAHEVAHIKLRHRLLAAAKPATRWLIGAVAIAAATFTVAEHTQSLPFNAWLTLVIVGAGVLPFAIFVYALHVFARRVQRFEMAADDLAQDWGYALTPQVAAWMHRHEPWLTRTRLYRPWRMHPLADERLHQGR